MNSITNIIITFSYYAQPHRAEPLSDAFVWRLSVAYIGPKLRTESPTRTTIGTQVAHVTRDSATTFKVKRSKGQLVADVLNSQHAGTGATWRINVTILWTCRVAEAYNVAMRRGCCLSGLFFWRRLQTRPGSTKIVCLFASGLMARSAQIGYIAP